MCDSLGMFWCGPVTSIRVLLGPEIFQDGDATELLEFNAGAGFALSSYLPHGGPEKVKSSFHDSDCGEGCGDRGPAMVTDDWPKLPAWTEKRSTIEVFDPKDAMFRGGAHMPLFGFLGNRPRRSDDAIVRRELNCCCCCLLLLNARAATR